MKTYSTLRVKFWTLLLTIISVFTGFSVLPNTVQVDASTLVTINSSGIVESGLIFHVDVANPESYSGTGNSIKDLSNGTDYSGIVGTPTLNSNGFLSFNGNTGNYFITRDLNSSLRDKRELTLELWVKVSDTSGVILSEHGSQDLTSSWRTTFIEYDATAQLLYADMWHLYGVDRLSTNIPNNSAVHIVLSLNTNNTTTTSDDVMSLYVNGELKHSGLKDRTIPGTNAPGIYYALFGSVSTHMVTTSPSRADFSQFRIYDRALTNEEVLANYLYTSSQQFAAEIGAPNDIVASSSFNNIHVSWEPPVLGSDPITGYQVEYKKIDDVAWTIAYSANDVNLRSITIPNLEENTSYFVRVAARSNLGIGLYGYPWQKLFETLNPRRDNNGFIVYTSGYGLGENDAYVLYSGIDYSRVRYRMEFMSADNFVDADFNRDLIYSDEYRVYISGIVTPELADRRLLNETFNLQVPTSSPTESKFIIKGDITDLTIHASGTLNQLARGLEGRLEIWPFNYGTEAEPGFSLADGTIYDSNDTPALGAYGSFQLHIIEDASSQTAFSWNRHYDVRPDIGFGSSSPITGNNHTDWTFRSNWESGNHFYLGIYINPVIQTGLAGEAYEVSFVLNGGTISDNPLSYTTLDTFPIELPTPTRTNYTFTGWFTSPSFESSVISQITDASNGSFTLHAKWITGTAPTIVGAGNRTLFRQSTQADLLSGLVVVGDENPTITVSGVIDYNTVEEYPVDLVVTDATGNSTVYPITVSIVLPKITYISDGFSDTTEFVESGTTLVAPTALNRADYDFVGWYYDAGFTNAVNFGTDVMPNENISLYAQWVRNYTSFPRQTVRVDTDAITTSGAAVVRVTIDTSNFAGSFDSGLTDVFFTSGLNDLLAFKRVSYNVANSVAVYDVLIPFVDVSNKTTFINLRYGISDDFTSGHLANTVTATPTKAFIANVTGATVPLRVPHNLIGANLSNFPVTVVLNSSNYNFTGFNTYKNSIHFILGDGTLLDFEVEYAEETQKLAIYHVRLPQVSSSVDNNFTIRYGGQQSFAQGFQAQNVWQAGYVFVSHMGPTLIDSTGNQTLIASGTTSQRIGNSFVRTFDRAKSEVIVTAGTVPITSTHTQLVRVMPLGEIGKLNYQVYNVPNNRFWNNKDYPSNNTDYNLINTLTPVATGVRSVGFVTNNHPNKDTSVGTANLLNWINVTQLNTALGITVRSDDFAIQLTGFFVPKETGLYTFTIEGDDAVEIVMNGGVVASHYGGHGVGALGTNTGTIFLTAGVPVTLQVRQQERGGGEGLRLFWRRPTQPSSDTKWYQYAEELTSVNVAARQDLISTHSGNSGYGLFIDNQAWVYSNGNSSSYQNFSFGQPSYGTFQTIGLRQGTLKTGFINGVLIQSTAADGMVDSSRVLNIGTNGSSLHFTGVISDVRLASVERTEEWIQAETLSMEGNLVSVLSPVAPSVATNSVSEVNTVSATVNATLVSDGNAPIDAYGVVFSTSTNPTTSNSKMFGELPAVVGEYSLNLTGLQSNTLYYVRAFATNSQGTVYGQEFTFQTRPSAPNITHFVARDRELIFDYNFPTGTLTSLEYSIDGGEWTNAGTVTGTLTLTGLTNDVETSLRIRVLNGSISSDASNDIVFTPLKVIPITSFVRLADQSVTFTVDATNSGLAGFKRFEYRLDNGSWIPFASAVTIPATTSGLEVRSLYQDDTVSAQTSTSFNTLTYVVSGLSSMDVLLLPTDSNYPLVAPQLASGQVFIGWFTDNTWSTKITEVSHGSNVTVETYSADPLAIPTYTFTRTLQRDLLLTFNTVDSENNPSQLLRLEYSVDNGVNWITYTQALNNAYWTSLGQTTIPVRVRPVYVGNTPSNSQLQFTLYPVNYRNNDNTVAFVEWVPENLGSFRLNQAIPELQNQVVILWYPTSARNTSAIEFTTMNTQAIDVYGRFEVGVYETSSGLINTLNPFAFANNVEQAGRIRISSSELSSGDRLFIRNDGNVNDVGVISEASGIIFIGNGTSRTKIGAIDSFFNGENGRDLVINVDSLLFNGDFSQQLNGWIINEFPTANTKAGFFNFGQFNLSKSLFPSNGPYYNLNCTTTYNSSTQKWNYATNCNDARSYERGNWSTIINDNRLWFTSQVVTISNQNWIQLASNGWTRTRQSTFAGTNDYGTLFGPTISSVQTFSAAAGDSITFDWQAVSGGDAADVYGFVIDDSVIINGRPRLIPVFYRRVPQGQNQSGKHVHTFTSADLPQASSSLRFFFVNGTYDQTGGGLFGATFRITNITLNSALKLNATSANAILAQLAIEVLTPDPNPIYSFTFSSETETSVLQSGVKSIYVKGINTPPTHNDNIILQVNPGANVTVSIDFLNDFTDPDSTLNFSATGLPSFLQLSSRGLLTLSGVAALTSDFSAVYSFEVTADDGEYSIARTYTFIVNPLPEETFWSHRASAQYTIDPVWFQAIPGFQSITSAGITVGTLPACITRTNLTLQALGCNEGTYVIPVSVTNGVLTYNFSATIHVSVDTIPPVISGVNSTTITTIQSSGLSLAEATVTDNLDGATVSRSFYPGFQHLVTPYSNRLIPATSGIESVGVYHCNLTTMICDVYTPSQNPSIENFSNGNATSGFTMIATSGFTGLEFFIDQDPILGAMRFVSGNNEPTTDPTHYYLYGQLSLTEWTLIASGATYLPEARLTAGSGVAINAITSYPAYRLVFDGPISDTWTIGDIEFYFIDPTQTLANEAAAITALSNRIPVFVNFVATDEALNTSSQTIRYNIVNFVPVVNQDEVIEVTEATAFIDYTLVYSTSLFIDTDLNESMVYSVTGLPPGLSFNPQTRTISGSPTLVSGLSVEPYTITLTATDTQGASVSRDHVIIVYYVADIIFDSNLGSSVDRQTRIIAQPVLPFKPADPERYAYDFIAWFTDSGLTTAYDWSGVMADATFTLYAKWIPVEYPIIYMLNSGINAANPDTFNIEQEVVYLDPSRYAYIFDGWFTDAEFTTITSGLVVGSSQEQTIHAKWTPIEYPITYVLNGGTNGANPETYNIEDLIVYQEPTRVGYDFLGWYEEETFITFTSGLEVGNSQAKTIYAKWTPTIYTITYNEVGSRDGLPATYTIESEDITLIRPTRPGLIFGGWSPNGFIPSGSIGDRTFTASWTARNYTLTITAAGRQLSRATIPFGANTSNIQLGTPPAREGFIAVGWSQDVPNPMPASNVTITAIYEPIPEDELDEELDEELDDILDEELDEELDDEELDEEEVDEDDDEVEEPVVEEPETPTTEPETPTPTTPAPSTPSISNLIPNRTPPRVEIPVVELPPNPDPVVTRVSVNGVDLDVSIIPGQPVGNLPAATLPGYGFKGWMNAITGEMITPETVINNPDFVVLVPLFEKAPTLLDAARNVFQTVISSPLLSPPKTNDFTERTDNIQSTSVFGEAVVETIPIRGGLVLQIREDGSVTIPLPNERTPIELNVTGLDAATLEVFYVVTDGVPEFDQTNWQAYSGEPFLTTQPGQNVYMMVKDGNDTHQVTFLRPATFISNPERIPASSLIIQSSDEQVTSLTQTKEHTFVTKIEYEDTVIDLFVIEPRSDQELIEVVVRYRANDHNKSMMLNVGAMSWRESSINPGNSMGVYVRRGDNLDFSLEYRYLGREPIIESFVVRGIDTGVSILLPPQPNMILRTILGVLIVTTLATPLLYKPKAS